MVIVFVLVVLYVLLFVVVVVCVVVGGSSSKVLVFYVFGDFMVDVGMNNYLLGGVEVLCVNFFYNGVDFFMVCFIGSFSNGYNGVDFLGK